MIIHIYYTKYRIYEYCFWFDLQYSLQLLASKAPLLRDNDNHDDRSMKLVFGNFVWRGVTSREKTPRLIDSQGVR